MSSGSLRGNRRTRSSHVARKLIAAGFSGALLVPVLAVAVAEPVPESTVLGAINVKNGTSSARLSGWIASDAMTAPAVHVIVDDRLVTKFAPAARRFDVETFLQPLGRAWGFDMQLESPVRSICVSAELDGLLRGIDCWYQSPGSFADAFGSGTIFGSAGQVVRYSVEVEARVGVHPEEFARMVDGILGDERSWTGDGQRRLRRVSSQNADVRFTLATPATVDRLCVPFQTAGRLSCTVGNHVVINSDRWFGAVSHWKTGLQEYRSYLVNHEIGHFLGFKHTGCPSAGSVAPIMLQQTKSLAGCKENGWPFP